jgi:hypothetical protein
MYPATCSPLNKPPELAPLIAHLALDGSLVAPEKRRHLSSGGVSSLERFDQAKVKLFTRSADGVHHKILQLSRDGKNARDMRERARSDIAAELQKRGALMNHRQ